MTLSRSTLPFDVYPKPNLKTELLDCDGLEVNKPWARKSVRRFNFSNKFDEKLAQFSSDMKSYAV